MIYAIIALTIVSCCLAVLLVAFFLSARKSQFRLIENLRLSAEAEALLGRTQSELDESKFREKNLQSLLLEGEKKISVLEEKNASLSAALDAKKTSETELKEKLEAQFKILSSQMFENARKEMAAENSSQVGTLLKPLRERIELFSKKMEDMNLSDEKRRVSFEEQVKHLGEMNARISKDAQNLANALKGDNKAAGDWGETVLVRLLETCGLSEGRDFTSQSSFLVEGELGTQTKRQRPDIIINLPNSRCVIVDSKVSLVDYERYYHSEKGDAQTRALKNFAASVKKHIDDLSSKDYEQIEGLNNPEFVLMFMPIEPAYGVLIKERPDIQDYAFSRKIVIVTPSTMLGMLKIIDNIWRVEKQNANALKIAEEGGKLYDALRRFSEGFLKMESQIESLKKTFLGSKNSLQSGRGNVLKRADDLAKLGVRMKKRIEIDFEGSEEGDGLEQSENFEAEEN